MIWDCLVGQKKDWFLFLNFANIIGFPGETRELAFDTIELNRNFKSDNTNCSILVPFHGTELHSYCVEKGYLDNNKICTVSTQADSMLTFPEWDKADITRLRDVFAMYIKFPKNRWPEGPDFDALLDKYWNKDSNAQIKKVVIANIKICD